MTYSYDVLSRIVGRTLNGVTGTRTFDALGCVATQVDPLGTFTYAYDGATGRIQSLTYPNSQVSSYTYFPNTGDRRLQEIHHQTGGGVTLSRFAYAYDAVWNITTWTQQYGTEIRAYDFEQDSADQLLSATYRTTGGTPTLLNQYDYRYDRVGNRTNAQVEGVATTAVYDNMNRLTGQTGGGLLQFRGTVSEPAAVMVQGRPATTTSANSSTADATAGVGTTTIAVTATDPSGNSTTAEYDVDGPATSVSLTYDANGNLTTQGTRTYEWDAENRLVRVLEAGSPVAQFAYDGFGRRVEKSAGGVTRIYVYDREDIIQERVTGGGTSRHVHGPGIDQPLATVSGGAVSYYLADHLGSVVQTTNSAQEVTFTRKYDPFGNLTIGSTEQGYAFTGREWDSGIGLYYYRARYFSPELGRFISADPFGLAGGMNLYRYVRNRILILTDPWGLCPVADPDAEATDSVTRALQEAIRRGNPAEIRNILDAAKDVLTPAVRDAGRNAVARLETKAKDLIAKELKGSVNSEFPEELRERTLEYIMNQAAKGDRAAKTAKKLLTDSRFKK